MSLHKDLQDSNIPTDTFTATSVSVGLPDLDQRQKRLYTQSGGDESAESMPSTPLAHNNNIGQNALKVWSAKKANLTLDDHTDTFTENDIGHTKVSSASPLHPPISSLLLPLTSSSLKTAQLQKKHHSKAEQPSALPRNLETQALVENDDADAVAHADDALEADEKTLTLSELSLPPTESELSRFKDVPLKLLPPRFKRDPRQRIFVNRNLSLEKIQAIGFDMDYTLAQYISPHYEELEYRLSVERLIAIGYPPEIRNFKYDPMYGIRGLFFDTVYGNLLKVDSFGNIVVCLHGKRILPSPDIKSLYPSKFIAPDDIGKRFYVMNTLFNIPESCLYTDVIEYFDHHPDYERGLTGLTGKNVFLSYHAIFQDIRNSVDWIHNQGTLKSDTMADLTKYVAKDAKLPTLLHRMRQAGQKTMLITNSGYRYTQALMTHLFDFPHGPTPDSAHRDWKSYFDIIIVDAQKPLFFADGTLLREVDLNTGSYKLGSVTGGFQADHVYAGGSSEILCKITELPGEAILYIGDHIFGDIVKSKKNLGWRTFLVVPELEEELKCWKNGENIYQHLQNMEYLLSLAYRGLTSDAVAKPDVSALRSEIFHTVKEFNSAYNKIFGSIFRSGSNQTFFAMQTRRYGDLYASTHLNLINYPLFYEFRAPDDPMPHESTTDTTNAIELDKRK